MESQYTYYSEYSVKSWASFLLNGEIKRPPYQRKFVWSLQKAYNLVKAVLDGNFVPPVVIAATQHDLGFKQDSTYEIPKGIYLVDGQQRLTSLLLFFLGIWPMETTDNPPKAREDNDEFEELANSIDTPLDGLMCVYKSQSSYGQLIEKMLDSEKYVRLEEIEIKKDVITKELKSDVNKLCQRIKCEEKNIFLERCLGYSYVRSLGNDENIEKRLFANLFRDINTTGQKLLPSESRRAMYFLEPSLKDLFDPDFLRSYTIGKNNIDMPRYLAYADELYAKFLSDEFIKVPSTAYIAYGYSNRQEDYILEYLTRAIDVNKKKSERFLKNMPLLESEFKFLFPDSDTTFESIPRFELHIFGLIFWVLSQGRKIDREKKSELSELKQIFKDYQHNPNQRIGGIRERLQLSVKTYQKVLKDA